MKLLAMLFTYLILTTSLSANDAYKADYHLQSSVRTQVEEYYAATGEWSVLKIKQIERLDIDSAEYVLMSAKVHIQNLNVPKNLIETCLVTFVQNSNEFYSINCF